MATQSIPTVSSRRSARPRPASSRRRRSRPRCRGSARPRARRRSGRAAAPARRAPGSIVRRTSTSAATPDRRRRCRPPRGVRVGHRARSCQRRSTTRSPGRPGTARSRLAAPDARSSPPEARAVAGGAPRALARAARSERRRSRAATAPAARARGSPAVAAAPEPFSAVAPASTGSATRATARPRLRGRSRAGAPPPASRRCARRPASAPHACASPEPRAVDAPARSAPRRGGGDRRRPSRSRREQRPAAIARGAPEAPSIGPFERAVRPSAAGAVAATEQPRRRLGAADPAPARVPACSATSNALRVGRQLAYASRAAAAQRDVRRTRRPAAARPGRAAARARRWPGAAQRGASAAGSPGAGRPSRCRRQHEQLDRRRAR